MLTTRKMEEYIALLRRELIPALGCTEPIAIAYAAAGARRLLGCMPTAVTAYCAGILLKMLKV